MNYYSDNANGLQFIFIIIACSLIFVLLYLFSILNKLSAKKMSKTDKLDVSKLKFQKQVDIQAYY